MLYFSFNYLLSDNTAKLDEIMHLSTVLLKNIRPNQITVDIFLYYAKRNKNINL